MKRTALLLMIIVAGCGGDADKVPTPMHLDNPLTVERVFGSPRLTGDVPLGLQISPDGRHLTFLQGKQSDFRVQDLWRCDFSESKKVLLVDSSELLKGADEKLSDEEQARRERQRISGRGIVEYKWSEDGNHLLFPLGGDLYLYTLASKSVRRLTSSQSAEIDPKFSPKGRYVSFVRDHDLFVIDLESGRETRLTTDGTALAPNGLAEFIAQEEMDRHTGYWWAPDDSHIAFEKYDESGVQVMKRFEVRADGIDVVEQRYPKAGTPNVKVKLGLLRLADKAVAWLDLPGEDIYLTDVDWLPYEDDLAVSYQVQSRDQKRLDLYFHRLRDARTTQVLSETDGRWVNVHHELKFLKSRKQFLWYSPKSGHEHVYLHDLDGRELSAVTGGPWVVTRVHAVDEEAEQVYFSGTKDSPLERHLYRASLASPGEPERLTVGPGVHSIVTNDRASFFVDYLSTETTPSRVFVADKRTGRSFALGEGVEPPLAKFAPDFATFEFHTMQNEGAELHYLLMKPKGFDPARKYPLVHFVYGGPGAQTVMKAWQGNRGLLAQILTQKGYVVLMADNRGTPGRGREFERAFYHQFGVIEVADQLAVADHVSRLPFVDRSRLGVTGHSYGGYLSAMLFLKGDGLYKAAVAGAPVVDWKLYDTHYTERYLGTPEEFPDVYRRSHVVTHLHDYRGSLLLIHGMADDNVLYTNSTQLYEALQKRGLPFDIMAYPGAKHGLYGKETEIHSFNTILNYFLKNL